ncbi:MAG: membrane protease YdiL (CAAX protease family) [Myxococcota bacterium]
MTDVQRRVAREIVVLWLVTLILIRGVLWLEGAAGLPEFVRVLVPVLFMYAPVALCRWRGVDSWDYPLALPALGDWPLWREALRLNAIAIAVVFVPFVLGYHLWHTTVFGHTLQWTWPSQPLQLIGYHLVFVAIPEEFFYRGYMQTRLDEVFAPRWRILGADIGWGLVITCGLFAIGHSVVTFQWWHPFIVFPSLVFGWMRAKTGDVMAGALFHAWSNITVGTLDTLYGVIPP